MYSLNPAPNHLFPVRIRHDSGPVRVPSLTFTLVEAGLSKVRAGAADTVATTNNAFFISQIWIVKNKISLYLMKDLDKYSDGCISNSYN